MKRFYSTQIFSTYILLSEEEAHHCTKVLRCKTGDKVEVLNGSGSLFSGCISTIQKHEVQIEITGIIHTENENKNKLSIGICPTKNPARIEWFIEKATEIGVVNIFPITTQRTEKNTIKHERLQHIIESAAKQSGQLYFPTLYPIQSFKQLINNTPNDLSQKLIAHCEGDKHHLKNIYLKNSSAILLIGPEGDFTSTEVQEALNKNYQPVSLGNSILRVETAGVVACSIIQTLNY